MRVYILLAVLALSLVSAPGASAAPCNGQTFSGVDCHIDYWQFRANLVYDTVEEESGFDLSIVQNGVNHNLDKWGAFVDDIYQDIPCVTRPGPVCW